MRRRSFTHPFAIVAAGTLVIAPGVALHFARAARAAEADLAALKRQLATASAERAVTRKTLADALAERDQQQTALRELERKRTSAMRSTEPKPRIQRGPTIDERLQKEPDTQVYWLASRRSEVAMKYRAFFRQAGLSAEKREAFHRAMIQRDEQVMDVDAIIRAQGLTRPDEPAAKMLAKADADLKATQRAVLGDDGFRQLQEYDRTSSLRDIVNGIAGGAVMVAREPLSSQQAEQLLQVMANASPSYQRGGAASTSEIDWDVVDAQARTFLSPAQYTLLTTMEPPLPSGARFQSKLYREVNLANKRPPAETAKTKSSDG